MENWIVKIAIFRQFQLFYAPHSKLQSPYKSVFFAVFFLKFSRKIMLIFSTRHICILIAWKTVYEMFKTLQIFLRRMQFGDQPVN